MFICKICNSSFETIRNLSNHLRFQEHITAKEYYDIYLKTETDGICAKCGKPTAFDCLEKGYKHHCCYKCANSDKEVQKKQQNTTLKHFGVLHPAQNKTVIKKMQKTCIEIYGATNGHGIEQKEKIKQKCLDQYGVESNWQRIDVKEKAKQTKIDRYGDENFRNKEKILKTLQDKYGVSNCAQLPDHRQKVKTTKQLRYGDENYNNSIKNQKTRKNNINTFELQNDCINIQTLIKKYGYSWLQAPIYKEIVFKHNGNCYIKNDNIKKLIDYIEETGSHLESDIYQYIKSIYSGEIIRRCRKVITPQELDIYIPDKKIAIEVNGMYWHSEQRGTAKLYHFNKSKECQEKGIRLIHIYEWEWLKYPEKIKQLLNIALGTVTKIYARQCEIKEITNKEAKPFNEATHLQGHRAAQVTYGLFYKNELVQLMSFSKTKYNRNLSDNEWEIIRGCPGSNNIVIGGVSKLFKHFIEDYKPAKVFSYCDFNKFDGKSYLALGMSFIGYTGPNKWWLLPDYSVIERNPKKYQELKGNNRIWGSGSLKFVYTP